MHIVNGLHEFLNDDAEFVAASLLAGVTMTDVRQPKEKKDLKLFSGRIFDVTCPRIAVLGTDGAIGKRNNATLHVRALHARSFTAVTVGTGQYRRSVVSVQRVSVRVGLGGRSTIKNNRYNTSNK